jgi:hypothetical protein
MITVGLEGLRQKVSITAKTKAGIAATTSTPRMSAPIGLVR